MVSPTTDDLHRFAESVERLCDYILSKAEDKTSPDIAVIQKLKTDAADFQHVTINSDTFIYGLDNYMRGFPNEPGS